MIDANWTGQNYYFTPCQDDQYCGDNKGMLINNATDGSWCYILSYWDVSNRPHVVENATAFTFYYINGESKPECEMEKSTWIPVFICQRNVTYSFSGVSYSGNAQCEYVATIYTKYACIKDSVVN